MSYVNPETGRKIKQGTRAFKKLLNDYDFDEINGFIPKNTSNKFYRDPSGFLISERMAQRWAKRSKRYDLSNNEIKFISGTKYDTIENAYHRLNNYKSVRVELNDGTFKTHSFQSTTPSKKMSELFMVFYHELENQDIVSYSFYGVDLDDNDIFTIAHNSNVANCVMLLVKEKTLKTRKSLTQEQEQLYNDLQEGVMPSDFKTISSTFKLNITLKCLDRTDKFISTTDKNSYLTLYYDNFHVSKTTRRAEKEKELITFNKKMKCKCKIDNLSFDGPASTCECDPLLNLFNQTPNTQIHNVIMSDELLSFSTEDYIYKNGSITYPETSQYPETTFILDNHEYNISSIFRKKLLSNYIKGTPPRPIYDFELATELNRTIMCNFQTLTANTKYYEIDIKSAYDPVPFKEYPSNLDIRITTDVMLPNIGFYLITIKDPIIKKKITQIYSTDELNVFNKHNVPYTIHNAFLSSSTFTIDNSWTDMKKFEKRIFHHWLGFTQRRVNTGTITTTDINVANRHGYRLIRDGLYQFNTTEEQITNTYMPQVSAFVQAYTRSQLTDYLLSNPTIKPLRIWCDNIVSATPLPLDDHFSTIFKTAIKTYKADHEKLIPELSSLTPALYNTTAPELLSTKTTNNIIYLNGFAGTGKTYTINSLIKYCDTHGFNYELFSPTYNTAKLFNATVIQKFENKPHKIYKDIIIVDEASMITKKQLNTLLFYSNSLIILSGDHENQLLTIEGDDIDFSTITTIKLTECKRTEDKDFVERMLKIKDRSSLSQLSFKHINQSSIDYTNLSQYIICATKKEVDKYNKLFYDNSSNPVINDEIKANMPVMVITNKLRQKTDGLLYNGVKGFFTGEVEFRNKIAYYTLILEDGTVGSLSAPVIKQNVKLCLALTYHKAQGQTFAKENIILSTEGLKYFCPDTRRRMLYVGASRVKKEAQLCWI